MKKITIFTDSAVRGNPGPAAVGVQVTDARGAVVREITEAIGNATSGYAGYYAAMRGLQEAKEVFGKSTKSLQVELHITNELVKRQLNAEHPIKEPGLVPYFIEIHNLKVTAFPKLSVVLARREQNKKVTTAIANLLDS